MDIKSYRHALGSFATGVCVITIADPDGMSGHVLGMTANSFTSVSLDPPLILWCIDFKAHRYSAYSTATTFGVNILSAGQEALSRRFARENAHIVPEELLISEVHPLKLRDVTAFLACETFETHLIGDHRVIVGRVTQFERDETAGGLTFFGGRYGEVGPISQDKIA